MKTLCKYTKKYLTIKHIDKKIIVVNVTILMRTLTKKPFLQRGDRILEHKLVQESVDDCYSSLEKDASDLEGTEILLEEC